MYAKNQIPLKKKLLEYILVFLIVNEWTHAKDTYSKFMNIAVAQSVRAFASQTLTSLHKNFRVGRYLNPTQSKQS